jgi:hypothetical protein
MRRIILSVALLSMLATVALSQNAPPPPNEVTIDSNQLTSRWPLQVNGSDAQITIFQPQLEDFQGDTLKARAAVSIQPNGQDQPIFGAVWITSRVATDRVARTVQIIDLDITKSRFPNSDAATQDKFSGSIKQALLSRPVTLSLDQLLSMLETVQKEESESQDLQNAPPKIIFREHPAVKVQYDGAPKLVQVENSPLLRVNNTPFFVVLDPSSKTYYLKGAGLWFSAPDPLGPFQKVASVPSAVSQFANTDDYKDPQQPLTNTQAQAVEIVTATDPTELIWSDGPPQMGTIEGTNLLYMTNTDSDVFLTIGNQQMYVLLSGRWYVGPNKNGPWTFVAPDKLPEDFAKIPPNSDQGDVLAHVAGTQAAQDAVADSEIPQTAAVDRKQYDQPIVEYDGDPQFDQVADDTSCSYAVNSPNAVILNGGRYYCCDNAVWYTASVATGPWDVCVSVPADIYRLPPSCPIYAVRYCYVYGYTPDNVYCGYLPGYVGSYRYRGCVVYGTGYHYHPWIGHHYYARPWTYGFAAHYNSYVGHWGFDFGLATGGGGRWIGSGPRAWGRREPWFGYGGYRPIVVHKDVNVDIFRNRYVERVRDVHVQSEHRDVYARNVYERRNDVRWEAGRPRGIEDQHRDATNREPVRAPAADNRKPEEIRNNVFSDKEGNVYRRTDNGWEARDKNDWKPAHVDEHPGPVEDHRNDRPAAGAASEHRDDHPAANAPVEKREDHPVEARKEPAAVQSPDRRVDEHPAEAQHPAAHPEPRGDNGDLNRDFHARQSGDQRLNGYQHSSAPAAPSRRR